MGGERQYNANWSQKRPGARDRRRLQQVETAERARILPADNLYPPRERHRPVWGGLKDRRRSLRSGGGCWAEILACGSTHNDGACSRGLQALKDRPLQCPG